MIIIYKYCTIPGNVDVVAGDGAQLLERGVGVESVLQLVRHDVQVGLEDDACAALGRHEAMHLRGGHDIMERGC